MTIACPQCLWTFRQTITGSLSPMRESRCVHCGNIVYCAIVEPGDWSPGQETPGPHRDAKSADQPPVAVLNKKESPYANIAERNVLLRARIEVPAGLNLTTKEFQEGWTCVSGDASQIRKEIRTSGWSFVKIADPSVKSGVGETSQKAIASALRLTLRRMSEHFNAVEVEHIELTQYPWFYLARIRIWGLEDQIDSVQALEKQSRQASSVSTC